MNNTKLIRLLKCLNEKELREFSKFVKSSFHNKRKDAARLLDLLKSYYPDFKVNIETENICFQLFPHKEPDIKSLQKLSSYLYSLGKEFLMITEVKQDKYYSQYFKQMALMKHNENVLYLYEAKHTDKLLENEKLDSDILERKYQLGALKWSFYEKTDERNKKFEALKAVIPDFIVLFTSRFISNYNNVITHKFNFSEDFDESVFNIIGSEKALEYLEGIRDTRPELHNYISFNYYLLKCVQEPLSDSYYYKLKDSLLNNSEGLSQKTLAANFPHVQSYCFRRALSGEEKFYNEVFELYQLELERITSPVNFISFFRNFVLLGIYAKQYDAVEKFINQYKYKILIEENGKDVLLLCNAWLYLSQKEFDKVYESLNKINFNYALIRLDVRSIYIRLYYEMNAYESFYSQLDSFRHFLRQNKEAGRNTLERYKDYLDYIERLANIKLGNSVEDSELLGRKINENVKLGLLKSWLTEKAEELVKEKSRI